MVERADARVARGFAKLGLGEATARLIAFGATVYLARLLGPGLYGVIVLATAILLYLGSVSDCGVDMLGVHDVARDPGQLTEMVPAYLGARLLVAAGLLILVLLVGLALFPQPEGAVLAAYALLLLPQALGTRWVQLGLQRSGKAALARVLTEAVAAIGIVLLVHGPGDVARAPLAQFAGESAGCFLLLRLLRQGRAALPIAFRLRPMAALLRRSWPLILHLLLGLLIFNSDFFFLRIFRGSAAVGYYAVAYALVSFFLNLGGAYEMSLLPAITRLAGRPEEQRGLYGSAMAQVFAGTLPVAVGGALLGGGLITLLFGAGYAASGEPLAILLWCVPLALFRNVAQTALVSHGRQDQMLRTVALASGANLLLNALAVPLWGIAGAAVATVATEALRTSLVLRYARHTGLPVPPPGRFLRVLTAAAVMALALVISGIRAIAPAVALGGGVYLLALLLLGGIRFQRGHLPELVV